ncbi:MAG: beta-galactosidase [Kiritimatiellae bacterium]|nr:beta-galactosidase [Kiritimatiellia bacterium]
MTALPFLIATLSVSPADVSAKLSEQLLSTSPDSYSPQGYRAPKTYGAHEYIHYSVASLWVNALECARLSGDRALEKRLVDFFEPAYGEKSAWMNGYRHVDMAIVGAIPLEIAILTGDERAKKLGLRYADRQWDEPREGMDWCEKLYDPIPLAERHANWEKGYSPETRLWLDDMYMMTLLQGKAYRLTGERKYIERAAKEMCLYLDRLPRPDGLFNHAPEAPFAWGRGNGWLAAAMAMNLSDLPVDSPWRAPILEGYRKMMASLLKWQRSDGLWGQLVDDPESYSETSATAMFAYAFAEGAKAGVLGPEYLAAAERAYNALVAKLDDFGNIPDVCVGTGWKNSRHHYLSRPKANGDPHGQAPMMWLCRALMGRPALSVGERIIPQGSCVAPNGDRLEVTTKCLRLDGKAMIPLMGEIHYSRVPREEWARSLKTMKEGGISIVSTYVFWNHHEWNEGVFDFSGNRDLNAFLSEVAKAGMWAIVRIGPWDHGECREGGLPDWLVERYPRKVLRSRDRRFMAEVEKFWTRLFPEVEMHLWKNGGPLIGVQLENESSGPWEYYMALKDLAVKIGFDVPMYTRTGWPELNGTEGDFGAMIPFYGDYAEGFWDRELKSMPGGYRNSFIMKSARTSSVIATDLLDAQTAEDAKEAVKYPYFTCELGGGMASSYHRRLNMEPMDAFAMSVVKLGSGSNLPGYYMYHGGSNPTDAGVNMAESQRGKFTNWNDLPIVSYEFQAPVSEFGEPQYGYWLLKALGDFCREYGEELAVEDPVFLSGHETKRGRFVFHNDYVRRLNPEGECWIGIEKDGKVERILDGRALMAAPRVCGPYCTCTAGENLMFSVKDLKLLKPAGAAPKIAMGPNKAATPPDESAWEGAAVYEVPFNGMANMLEIAYEGDMARLYADGMLVQDDFWKGKPLRFALRRLPAGTRKLILKVLPWGEGAKESIFIDLPAHLQTAETCAEDAVAHL